MLKKSNRLNREYQFVKREANRRRSRRLRLEGLEKRQLLAADGLVETIDLVAHYQLNGNAIDSSDNANHAVIYGATPTTDRFGNPNSAYYFDGVNDFIQTPVNGNLNPLSFSVWFKADTTLGEQSIIDSDRSGTFGHSLILGYWNGDGELDLQYHNGPFPGAPGTGNTGFYPEAGQWYHVVVNFGPRMEVFVDGTEVASWDYDPAPPGPDGSNYRIGRHNIGDPQWFQGSIDDVRFYNRVLTSEEAGVLANEGAAPTVSIGDSSVTEGGDLVFDVELSAPVSVDTVIAYSTTDGTATVADSDYTGVVSQTVTIPAGSTSAPITVATTDDNTVELDENLIVSLSDVGASVALDLADIVGGGDGTGTGGAGGVHPVTGAAVAGGFNNYITDSNIKNIYRAVPSSPYIDGVFIPDGGPLRNTPVPVSSTGIAATGVGDSGVVWDQFGSWDNIVNGVVSSPDYYALDFSTTTEISFHANKGITFDLDAIEAANAGLGANVTEFTGIAANASYYSDGVEFTVVVDGAVRAQSFVSGGTSEPISVSIDPSDRFLTLIATDGGGIRNFFWDHSFWGDPTLVVEEEVVLDDDQGLGTIVKDDSATVSVGDATVTEGGDLVFDVELSSPVDVDTVVTYSTTDGTGTTADSDYTGQTAQTVTILAGQQAATITVSTTGDSQVELDETIGVSLVSVDAQGRNVTLGDASGEGTIENDDSATVSIGDATVVEGGDLQFPLTLSNPVDVDTVVIYSTADGTATLADNDYTGTASGTATILAGSTSGTITVATTDDNKAELDETIGVSLGGLDVSGRDVSLESGGTSGGTMTFTNADLVGGSAALTLPSGWTLRRASSFEQGAEGAFDGVSDNPGNGRLLFLRSGGSPLSPTNFISLTGTFVQPVEINAIRIAHDFGGIPASEFRTAEVDLVDGSGNVTTVFGTGLEDNIIGDIDDIATGLSLTGIVSFEVRLTGSEPDQGGLELREIIFEGPTPPEAVGTIVNDDYVPIANAGGVYVINEGDSLTLDASASTDVDDGLAGLTFRWDVDGDGDFDEGVTGVNPTLTLAQLDALGLADGPHTNTVTVEASDGTNVDTATTTLTINNVLPMITSFSTDSPDCGGASENETVTATLAFDDPGTVDVHTVVIDWGDGTVDALTVPVGDRIFEPTHTYTTGGVFEVTVSIADDDQPTILSEASAPVTVSGVGVVGDTLYIIGTDEADHVSVNQTGKGVIKVHADFLDNPDEPRNIDPADYASGVSNIVMLLCGGDDHGTISSGIELDALIDGGAGDDHLNGGNGQNIIFGGLGADHINGGSRNDILIGGQGEDRLVGNAGRDYMYGGDLDLQSAHHHALLSLLSDWDGDSDGDAEILSVALLGDGGAEDKLTGSSAEDFVLLDLEDMWTDRASNGKGKGGKSNKN